MATEYDSAPCKLTISSHSFARWHLFCHVGHLRHQQHVDLLTLKVVSESRVTWATCVPILVFLRLCSRVRPDVRDRQTEVRQKHRLMPPPYGGGGIISAHDATTLYYLAAAVKTHSRSSSSRLSYSVLYRPSDDHRSVAHVFIYTSNPRLIYVIFRLLAADARCPVSAYIYREAKKLRHFIFFRNNFVKPRAFYFDNLLQHDTLNKMAASLDGCFRYFHLKPKLHLYDLL